MGGATVERVVLTVSTASMLLDFPFLAPYVSVLHEILQEEFWVFDPIKPRARARQRRPSLSDEQVQALDPSRLRGQCRPIVR